MKRIWNIQSDSWFRPQNMCFLKLLELFKNDKVSGNSHVGGGSQGGSLLKY